MTRKKPSLIWDHWNREHIKKHHVVEAEVEEAYINEFARSDSYKKREAIFGTTVSGKLITIVVSYAKQPEPYIVSARTMSVSERKKYVRKAQTN